MGVQLGTFSVPSQADDPTSPIDGQVWYNTTRRSMRGYQNGAYVDMAQMVSVNDLLGALSGLIEEISSDPVAIATVKQMVNS